MTRTPAAAARSTCRLRMVRGATATSASRSSSTTSQRTIAVCSSQVARRSVERSGMQRTSPYPFSHEAKR